MFYEKPQIAIENGKAVHKQRGKLQYGEGNNRLQTYNGQSNFLFKKHFTKFINQLNKYGAQWNEQVYGCHRALKPAMINFFARNFARQSMTGHALFHKSKFNENGVFTINGARFWEFPYAMDVAFGTDCGTLTRTPMEVQSCLIGILILSNIRIE